MQRLESTVRSVEWCGDPLDCMSLTAKARSDDLLATLKRQPGLAEKSRAGESPTTDAAGTNRDADRPGA